MFTGINKDICANAWAALQPSIEHMSTLGITNRHAGVVIVLDPNESYDTEMFDYLPIVFTGQASDQDYDKYREIAWSKASLSWRTGLPSSLVQTQYPYLYQEEDTKWGGSTVDKGGLIVAFSGVQAVYDEMISEWMASAIRALCRNEMPAVMAHDSSFLLRGDIES